MSRNSRQSGAGRARRAWLGAAGALLLISAQPAYGGTLWGVVVSANDVVTYDSATGGPGSGSTGDDLNGYSWYSPTAAGLKSADVGSSIWLWSPPLTASAQASGSLLDASVSVFAAGEQIYDDWSSADASARIYDTLTFDVAGATSSTVTDIGVHFTVQGDDQSNPYWASFSETLQLGAGNVEYDLSCCPGKGPTVSGWVSGQFSAEDPTSLIFDGKYEFQGPSATVPFSMEVSTGVAGETDSRSASVSLFLPPGVTYTSASEAFPAMLTPEPAAWTMMLLGGLGLIGLVRIRKR